MIWDSKTAKNLLSEKMIKDFSIEKIRKVFKKTEYYFEKYRSESLSFNHHKTHPQRDSFHLPRRSVLFSFSPTQYIGLKARLSQVALNKYSIFCFLLIIKIFLFSKSLSASLSLAESYTSHACQLALSETNQLSTLPQTLGTQANKFIAKGIETMVDGLVDALVLLISIIQNLVIFFVNFMTSTYTCLIMSTVEGTVSAALNATETIIEYTNKTISVLTDSLQNGFDDINDLLNSATGTINDISSFFTGRETSLKQVKLTLGELEDFHIPSDINDKLESLRNKIPNFESVQNKTDQMLSIPFHSVKNKILQKLGNNGIGYQFDSSQLSAPTAASFSVENTGDFCSIDQNRTKMIPQIFDNMKEGMNLILNILLIVLVLFAILFIGLMTFKEFRKWKWMKTKSIEFVYLSESNFNPKGKNQEKTYLNSRDSTYSEQEALTLIDNIQRPYSYRVGSFLMRNKTSLCRIHTQWFINFISFPYSLNLLLLSTFGLMAVLLQYILLSKISSISPNFETPASELVQHLSLTMKEQASSWIENTNIVMNNTEKAINRDLLGWVQEATVAANNTVSTFMEEITTSLKSGFEGTPLYKPIESVVYCLIGMKLENIEKGLTWVHQKATIKFPRVDEQTLLLGISDQPSNLTDINSVNNITDLNSTFQYHNNEASHSAKNSSSAQPLYQLPVLSESVEKISDKTSKLLSSTLETLIESFTKSLKVEFYISLTLFLIWFFGIFLTSGIYTLIYYKRCENQDYSLNESIDKPPVSNKENFEMRERERAHISEFDNSPAFTLVNPDSLEPSLDTINGKPLPPLPPLPPPPPASHRSWKSPHEETDVYEKLESGMRSFNIKENSLEMPIAYIKTKTKLPPSFSTWNFSTHFEPPAIFLDSPPDTGYRLSSHQGSDDCPSSLLFTSPTETIPLPQTTSIYSTTGLNENCKPSYVRSNTENAMNSQRSLPTAQPLEHYNILARNMIIEPVHIRKSTRINHEFSYT